MVDNKAIRNLIYTGLSEYESRAYMSLLGASPATAYEVAHATGISTSKIYGVMARLLERGVVAQTDVDGKTKYVPQDPEDFLNLRRHMMDTTLSELALDLAEAQTRSEVSTIWNISSIDQLLDKAASMVRGATQTLLLSLWTEEAEDLMAQLRKASQKGVRIATVHFGPFGTPVPGMVYVHPIRHTLLQEKGGRSIVVVADGAEALVGTIRGNQRAEGAHSRNDGFVSMAEDYIKHDIYMMKVVRRLDPQLKQRFGPEYEKLRDVFSDEEEV